MIVDNKLTWKPHIDILAVKISKTVGIIGNLKNFLPNKILLMIYNSLVKSKLNYAIEIWGNTTGQNLKRLKLIQKRAMRHISKQNWRAHSLPLFAANCCLIIEDMYKVKVLNHMFQIKNDLAPHNIVKLFKKRDNNILCTRNSGQEKFCVKQHRTNLKARMPSVAGVKLWNQLPKEITMIDGIGLFKNKLKDRILGSYF